MHKVSCCSAAADESSATPAKATVSVPAGPDSRVRFAACSHLKACGGLGRAAALVYSLQGLTYGLYAEFQAQEAEFDYLRSMEIEERINDVRGNRIESLRLPQSITQLFF